MPDPRPVDGGAPGLLARVAAAPPRLRAAVAAAAVGALLLAAGPIAGVAGPAGGPSFPSWPLLAALAVLPVALAAPFLASGRPLVAAGVLLGPALLAPGMAIVDMQLVADAGLAARPELFVPTSLAPLHPGAGVALLLVGHAAMALAGVLALGRDEPSMPVRSGAPAAGGLAGDDLEPAVAARAGGQGRLTIALCIGVVAAAALAGAPFRSDDPYLLSRAVVDAPTWVLIGGLLTAVAVPLAAGLSAGAAEPATSRGGLLGTAAAVASVAAPPLAAALFSPTLHVTWGPFVALLAAAVLAGMAWPAGRPAPTDTGQHAEIVLPGQARLQAVAGVVGVAAGFSALAAALLPQIAVPKGLPQPDDYPSRLLLPAGVLVIGLGVAMMFRTAASAVRPAFIVTLAAIPLAAAGALDEVLAATDVSGVRPGPGAWLTGVALAAALAAACCAGLAGGVERDEVDLTEVALDRGLLAPAAVAGLLAVAAFGLPAVTAPDFVPAGLWAHFSTESWGLLCGLVAVLGAAGLAPLCRRPKAAALLLGAAGVVGVRLLEMPLTAGRTPGSTAAGGTWFAAACGVLLLAGAALALRGSQRSRLDSGTR